MEKFCPGPCCAACESPAHHAKEDEVIRAAMSGHSRFPDALHIAETANDIKQVPRSRSLELRGVAAFHEGLAVFDRPFVLSEMVLSVMGM